MDEEASTAEDLLDALLKLNKELLDLRKRADDREVQYHVISSIDDLANLKLPTGYGADLDKALVSPKAAAMLLMKSMRRARKHVPTLPHDIDDLVRCIDRLRKFLHAALGQAQWTISQTRPTPRMGTRT